MRKLLFLSALVGFVWWFGPGLLSRLPTRDRSEMERTFQEAKNSFVRLVGDIVAGAHQPSILGGGQGIPVADPMLMEPGMWAISVQGNMNGRMLTNSGTRCVSAEKIRDIMSSGGQGLLDSPGGSCQLQQSLQGNRLVASGHCALGGMSLMISSEVTFDSNEHFVAQMSESFGGQNAPALSGQIEGRRLGPC